jgi:hypothetical protein
VLNLILLGVFSVTFGLVVAVGVSLEHWPFMENFAQTDLQFGDLGVLLVMADFLSEHPTGNPYTDFPVPGYTPNYPLLIPRFLALAGLGIDDVLAVGLVSSAVLCLSLGLLLIAVLSQKTKPMKFVHFLLLMALAFSPPVMLLLERGNYDIWIFFLVLVAGMSFSKHPKIALVFLTSAAALKIFPIAGMLAFLSSKKLRWWVILAAAGLLTYAFAIRDQLASVSENTPRPNWAAFGSLVVPSFIDLYVSQSQILQITANVVVHAIGIFCGIWLLQAMRGQAHELVLSIKSSPMSQGLLLVGGSTSIFIYLIGNNFDYRLVFLLIPLSALLLAGVTNELKIALISSTFFVFLWSFPANQISPLADFVIIPVLTVYSMLVFWVGDWGEVVYNFYKTFRRKNRDNSDQI